jgi:hypothetical protein
MYREFDGIMVPTRRQVYVRNPPRSCRERLLRVRSRARFSARRRRDPPATPELTLSPILIILAPMALAGALLLVSALKRIEEFSVLTH